jgi:hypothetical protein
MKETKDDSLFAELTAEESASVNGGCYTYRNSYRPTRHVVYRRNCDGSFRRLIRYY